jgi:hypothetical protein
MAVKKNCNASQTTHTDTHICCTLHWVEGLISNSFNICLIASENEAITIIHILDVSGSLHHSKIHKEKANKMQQCIKILLLRIYTKLNMFRATHRPSSGA